MTDLKANLDIRFLSVPTEETALLPQYVVEVQYFFGKARAGAKGAAR